MPRYCPRSTVSAYLIFYNTVLAIGWASVCFRVLHAVLAGRDAYHAGNTVAKLLQLVSLLEIIHAASGLVKSGILSNVLQWGTRAPGLMLLSWGVGEALRYPCYAALQGGVGVPVATWLRYSAFIPIYPAGVVFELASIWLALPAMQDDSPFDLSMPNAANMVFHHASFERLVLVIQPIAWLQLYTTLLKQRQKRLTAAVVGKGKRA